MKKYCLLLIVLLSFSCENTVSKYPKELQKIFKKHGEIEAWNNVRTVYFTVDDKSFTVDRVSGKKVVNAPNYSLGFDGKNYWKSENCPIEKPKEFIETYTTFFMMPFVLENEKDIKVNTKKNTITSEKYELIYDTKFQITSVKTKTHIVAYKDWQTKIGFLLPKEIAISSLNNNILVVSKNSTIFKEVNVNQVTFDDRFYQKPE